MIKNLLEQHADQPNRSESEIKETIGEPMFQTTAAPQYVEVNEAEDVFETPQITGAPVISGKPESAIEDGTELPAGTINFYESHFGSPAETISETNDETANYSEANFSFAETSISETENAANDFKPPVENRSETPNFVFPSEAANQKTPTADAQTISQTTVEPQSFAETARQSGLAYAAAITLFASVVFMLIIGWFADLLFGSSPWGKVGGIVLGSLIGFIQLFRITSQIFKNKP